MSLLKVKVTSKFEYKLYNYNKILRCTNINSKLQFLSLLAYYLYYYLYKNTTHNMYHHVFMYDERDENNNSQINGLIKYIPTHMKV